MATGSSRTSTIPCRRQTRAFSIGSTPRDASLRDAPQDEVSDPHGRERVFARLEPWPREERLLPRLATAPNAAWHHRAGLAVSAKASLEISQMIVGGFALVGHVVFGKTPDRNAQAAQIGKSRQTATIDRFEASQVGFRKPSDIP